MFLSQVLFSGLILAISFQSRAQVSEENGRVYVFDQTASELFAYLPTKETLEFKCIKYEYRAGGGDGTLDAICREVSSEVVLKSKSADAIDCKIDLEAGSSYCTIPVESDPINRSGFTHYTYGGSSNELGKSLKGVFKSSDGKLTLACNEYVRGRVYGCEAGVAVKK